MNKKGFTLAEILGVIVIIGTLFIVLVPASISRINNSKNEAEKATNKIIYDAAAQYIAEHRENFKVGKSYCLPLLILIEEGKLTSPIKDIKTGETIDDKYSVEILLYDQGNIHYKKVKKETCNSLE